MTFKRQTEGLDKGTGQNRLYCHTLNILLSNADKLMLIGLFVFFLIAEHF